MKECFSKTKMCDMLGKPPIQLHSSLSAFPVDTNIGIELEIENWMFGEGIDGALWCEDRDGSLRNNGVELISTVLSGYRVISALRQLDRYLPEQSPDVNERTSFHLHLDVLDLTMEEFQSLVYLMTSFEPVLLQLCAEHRRCSSFALPLSHAPEVLRVLRDGFDHWSDYEWKSLENNGLLMLDDYKYGALNFASIGIHGTVEFRMHQGTVDTVEIRDWITLCTSLKQWAKEFPTLESVSEATSGILLHRMHSLVSSLHYEPMSLSVLAGLIEEGQERAEHHLAVTAEMPPELEMLQRFRLDTQQVDPFEAFNQAVTPEPTPEPDVQRMSFEQFTAGFASMERTVERNLEATEWVPAADLQVNIPTARTRTPVPEPVTPTPTEEEPTRPRHPFMRFFGE